MKKLVLSLLFVMQVVGAWAQQTASVQGKVVDSKSQKPLENVVATLQATGQEALTNAEGVFVFKDVIAGSHVVTVGSAGYVPQTFTLEVAAGQPLDMGVVALDEDVTAEQQLSLITLTDNDLGDDNSGSDNTAGLLQSSRDVFQQAAAFNWGIARFRMRGLDTQYGTTMINGVVMNKLYDGRPQWSNWGGLNDATRNQEFTMGSSPSDYTFGSILGTQEINTRASIFRPGARVSFSGTNTNYSWRAMGTYASGMDRNGWAYVVSASRRWAQEGHFEGTDYSANSGFISVEKKFSDHHSLNFTGIYAQNSRGKNSPNTQETTDLAGVKYNSYWGYQDGKKRNSRDKDVEEPILMLSHFWNINDNNSLTTNVSYQFGKIGNSRLDYQNANNPDPTYYRNLPSYYVNLGSTPEEANGLALFNSNQQVNWNAMYQTNLNTANGRSAYVLYEDRTDDKTLTANSIFRSQLSDNIVLNAGATYKHVKSHNFQNLLDLLGGQFYEDVDNFYTGSFSQSDLNHPGRTVGVGDTFGYNYNLFANNIDAFTQFKFTYTKFDFYLAQNFSRSEYQREGLYRNGLYANNSYGKSQKAVFENYGFKGGVTYKLNGRNMVIVNAARITNAPTLRNTFPNSRINNTIVDGISSETLSNADISYVLRTPHFKGRLTGFYSTVQNSTQTSFFYGEGVVEGADADAFVAETVTGINKRMMGAELGLEYQITPTIKVNGSASFGHYTYTNNPNVSINNDALATLDPTNSGVGTIAANPATTVDFGKAYLKGYKLSGTPQQAYSVGVEYRDPHFWWVGANANYLASNYIDLSSLIRTANFFKNPATGLAFSDIDDAQARKLLKQEKFDPFYLFNINAGKSWRLGGQTVGFFASVNNVLNKTYKTGGFEQSRSANYVNLQADTANGTPSFGPKYFYGYGRTYFVNFYINF